MMRSGGGEYYFTSEGFGYIDSPPWPACRSAGASGARAAKDWEGSYMQAALLEESNKAYFVFDYSPSDGLLRVIEKRVGEGLQGKLQLGDQGEACASGVNYATKVEGDSSELVGQGSSTSTSSSSSSTSSSSSSSSEGAALYSSAPVALTWVDLDSPESFLDLQDIDDSWLDSLPPIHTPSPLPSHPDLAAICAFSAPAAATPSPLNNFINPNPYPAFENPPSSASASLPLSSAQPAPASPPPVRHLVHERAASVAPDRKRLKRLDLSEPKYVVLTRNYESVLKDGFKWRKYGQKSVKSNIYPRSYYKCSYEGCYVHKHVERVAVDPCLILTTYRGRHNH